MPSSLPTHSPRIVPPKRRGLGAVSVAGIVIASLVLAAALGIFAVAGFGLWVWLHKSPQIDDARAAADQYVTRIEQRDDAAAFEQVCDESRAALTAESFTALVEAGPRPTGHTIERGFFTTEAAKEAQFTAHLTTSSGASRDVDLEVVLAGDDWRVCGDTLI
ncbi:hypothetical protein ACQPZX_19035 [Actinoplanes sp. CA-142083]|uniref:Rv0361 family membrane protein n=1 Tax=Actinoplanes sp. CA-142083 TaxID=3239903 RepID=UPI003D946631